MRHFATLAIIIFLPGLLWAQPGPGSRPYERIEQWKKVRMIEMLDLNEEQSVRFFARMNDHEKAERALRQERMEILDRLERMVRGGAEESDYAKAFAQVRDVDTRIDTERQEFFDNLKNFLSTEQRAKLMLFERRFDSELRQAMRELRRREGRGQERE